MRPLLEVKMVVGVCMAKVVTYAFTDRKASHRFRKVTLQHRKGDDKIRYFGEGGCSSIVRGNHGCLSISWVEAAESFLKWQMWGVSGGPPGG